MLPVRPPQTLSMLTRDGVRLDADVYYPDSNGEFPVLLMRQPYGRSIASTVVYAHPSWYAAQGYIVVIQDVRGRGTSEGEFDLFAHEITDGVDTVNWVADLLQSNGNVGMYGFSYQGMTQLYAAIGRPAALKTLCPAMAVADLYHNWAYEGGAFCYQLNLGWAIQLAAETVRRKGDAELYQILYAASRDLSLADPVAPRSGLLKHLAPDSFYHIWLDHPHPDEYWQRLSPKFHLSDIDLPMLHIGGWFDTYLRGTLNLYEEMASRSQLPQHLLIGPWTHLPWGRRVGAIDYGIEANSPVDRLQIRWFDHFLKGIDTGLLQEPAVCLFEMGSNQWRKFDRFPTPTPQAYTLRTTGLSALDERAGLLEPLSNIGNPTSNIQHPDTFVHDPWRPVPSLGGHAASPAGAFDRSHLDSRSDVVTYTSAPLDADLHLVGKITVLLHCTVDAASFDLCAVLSEVKPNGSVYNFSQGYLRTEALTKEKTTEAEVVERQRDEMASFNAAQSLLPTARSIDLLSPTLVEISLQPTCICIAQGNAIRLSISAACFPAYAVNPGTGDMPAESQLVHARVITVTIYSEGNQDDRLSQVLLPIEASE